MSKQPWQEPVGPTSAEEVLALSDALEDTPLTDRVGEAEFRTALAKLFRRAAEDMAYHKAHEEIPSGFEFAVVCDGEGFACPDWTTALAAARAYRKMTTP